MPYLQAALPRLAASRCFRVALALTTVCRVASICQASRALLALRVFHLLSRTGCKEGGRRRRGWPAER